MYDVFFICYAESNQEENWKRLLEFHSTARKISGVTGIGDAHMMCNDLSTTDRFWTVDGDNWLLEKLEIHKDYSQDLLFFNATDPIDGYASSIGGVKLWRKNSFINKDMSKGDFCKYATSTSLLLQKTLSIHKYNNTPQEAWQHSFRHMVKCFSGMIGLECLPLNIKLKENHRNLNIYSYQGYLDAKLYVDECGKDFEKLNLINDYDWLRSKCPAEIKKLTPNNL
jgi:hypothetical protein